MPPVHPTRRLIDTSAVIFIATILLVGVLVATPQKSEAAFHGNFGSFATSVGDKDFVPVLEDAPGGEAFCFGYITDSADPTNPAAYAWLFHIATGGTCAGSSPQAHRSWLITGFGGSTTQRWITTADTSYTGRTFSSIQEISTGTEQWICSLESDGVDGYSIGDGIYIKHTFSTGATQQLAEHDLRLSALSTSTLTPFTASVGIVKTTDQDFKRGSESAATPPTADPSSLPVSRTMQCGGFQIKMLNMGSLSIVNSQDVFYLVHSNLLTDDTVYPGMLRVTSTSGVTGHGQKVLTANTDNKRTLHLAPAMELFVIDDLGSGDILDRKLTIQQDDHPAGDNSRVRMHDIFVKRGTGHTASSPGTLATQAPTTNQIGVGTADITTRNALAGQIYYIDTAPLGEYSANDLVYLKHPDNGVCTAGMEVGDIRLNVPGQTAGTSVRSSDSDFLSHQGTAGICGFQLKLFSDRDDTRAPLKPVTTGKFLGASTIWDPANDPVFLTTASTVTDGLTARQIWDPTTETPMNTDRTFNCPADPECTTSFKAGKVKTTGQSTDWLGTGEGQGDKLYWSDTNHLAVGAYRMGPGHTPTSGQVQSGHADVDPGALFQSSGVTLFASQNTGFVHPTAGDVQIFPSFGNRWTHTTTGAVPMLQTVNFELVRKQLGDAGTLNDDAYYMDFSAAGDFMPGQVLRLTPAGDRTAGSFLQSGDTIEIQSTEFRTGHTNDEDHFGYIDNSPSGLDSGDFIYLNLPSAIGGSAGETLTQWDSRITPVSQGGSTFAAGTKVMVGNTDHQSFSGDTLIGAGTGGGTGDAQVLWWDTNHNGVVDQADALWLRLRTTAGLSTGIPTFLDVRLNGAPASGSSPPPSGGGTPPPPPATAPSASFSTEMDGRMLSVDAAGSSATSGRTITEYSWDFGDENTESGTGLLTTTHTYDEEGQYTVRLTVTDSQGETGTTTQTVQTDGYDATTPPSDDVDEVDEVDEVDDDGDDGEEEGSPGPALIVVLAMLAMALVVLRRRR